MAINIPMSTDPLYCITLIPRSKCSLLQQHHIREGQNIKSQVCGQSRAAGLVTSAKDSPALMAGCKCRVSKPFGARWAPDSAEQQDPAVLQAKVSAEGLSHSKGLISSSTAAFELNWLWYHHTAPCWTVWLNPCMWN